MKILRKLIVAIFCVTSLLQNIQSKTIIKREMLYQPNRGYLKKVSIEQEIGYCVEICSECLNEKSKEDVYLFKVLFLFLNNFGIYVLKRYLKSA